MNSCHQYLGKYCWELFTSNLGLEDGKFHFALNNMTVGEVFLGIFSTLSRQPNTKINIKKMIIYFNPIFDKLFIIFFKKYKNFKNYLIFVIKIIFNY